MAFVHVYVDFAATDDTGAGTVGDPWKTLQHAVDTVSATDGNQINVRSNTAHVLSTAVGWGSYSPTNTGNNFLIFRGYTTTADDGGVGEINGNAAVANLFSPSSMPLYINYIDLKLHNTTNDVIAGSQNTGVIRCEVYNGGSSATLDLTTNSIVIGCHLHTGTSGARGIDVHINGVVIGNYVTGHDDYPIKLGDLPCCLFNLVEGGGGGGILLDGSGQAVVMNNTSVGDSTASVAGIRFDTNAVRNVILSNIIKDWDGTSAVGLEYAGAGTAIVAGYNNFHNNTTDITDEDIAGGLDLTSNDTTTDPTFTNAAGQDYRVGTNAQADGYPMTMKGATSTTSAIDVGCSQRVEAGGGGGGGKQAGGGGGQVG